MKKYLALVKLLFVQQYKARPSAISNANGKKKRGGTVALYIILAVCFLPILYSIAVAMYYMGRISGGNVYVGTFLTLMSQGLVLMFGVHAIISNVFVVKDADKLLYLPVRPHTIFLAKLTVAYLNEIITTAATILVALLPFGMGAGAGFAYYVTLLFALLLIPMLPMLLGCLVAMPFSAIIARIGKNSAVKTVLRIVIYVVIMAVYIYAMYSFGMAGSTNGNLLEDPEMFIQDIIGGFVKKLTRVMPYFHPNYMLMSSMVATTFTGWLVGFVAALGENLALLAVVFLVSLPFYRRMLTLSLEEGSGGTRKINKEQYIVRNKGVVKELMLTDLKRTVRDGQLGFQSFAGIIMMPLIVVILYFFMGISEEGNASFLQLMAEYSIYQVIAPLLILAYMLLIGIGTNILGLFPISRENKSAYMLKSLPVPFSKILLAKVLLATAVMVISDFITCVLIVALLGVSWYYGIAMLVTLALVGFGSMCITTLLDLKEPRFGWANFQQSLKNTKNSWIAMLIGLLSVVAIAIGSVLFVVWYSVTGAWYAVLIMWLLIFGIATAFAVVSYKIMSKKSTKYFENIEI